ncbi:DUF2846 domain-containing protein [Pontibacterium granulatum]|uniref:DUF2846 domain-containing protein n=1 Tax=Pontibacterium granulatum TaxID=2036029 RepID=UPI00249BF166|nr:DUF2846 domain-containing protein [Pontibacterium granulatum]MDI3326739.1 DUF2846 domain-containing protein [Pontibacterium granulatum]
MKLLWTACFIVTALISGCASVPMASLDKDVSAKSFSPPAGRASLYIYRNEVLGSAIPMTVLINGKNLGQTASKTYFHLDLLPGTYEVDSVAENTSNIKILLKERRNYFIWQEVKMGAWMARSLLQEVDEDTGREGVLESKLIKVQVPEEDILPLERQSSHSILNQIRELDELRKDGIITDEEFEVKKKTLLEKL